MKHWHRIALVAASFGLLLWAIAALAWWLWPDLRMVVTAWLLGPVEV